MKHTFKSWLIANIESIVMVITFASLLLLYLKVEDINIFQVFGVLFLISLLPTTNISEGLVIFAIALVFCGGTLYFAVGLGWTIAAGIISLIGAVMTATFVYNHTEEVLSRRYFYRSSNVDYLKFKMKYTIERFFTSFRCLVVLCLLVWFMFNHHNELALLK